MTKSSKDYKKKKINDPAFTGLKEINLAELILSIEFLLLTLVNV